MGGVRGLGRRESLQDYLCIILIDHYLDPGYLQHSKDDTTCVIFWGFEREGIGLLICSIGQGHIELDNICI